ncbi:unnamed protein product [Hydatigera taeniaeformis]|uniref:Dephospho-CoA kinase n=1 Tax=Hydatigena taeniaeformis TaxID=6205 RepID=A0A3P7GZA0_HYDTA|nr:unnamed protein product [Hydatigera taeniaeformis]
MDLLGRPLLRSFSRRGRPSRNFWLIGLTGAITSGKSTIAKYLAECGGNRMCLLDADAICRRAYE